MNIIAFQPNTLHPLEKNFRTCSVGFALGDVTGGWLDGERGFGAKSVLIFVKGIDNPLPEDFVRQMESAWPSFRDYANTPGVPLDEKTQAYHRAKSLQGE